jgi:hypothetical protein
MCDVIAGGSDKKIKRKFHSQNSAHTDLQRQNRSPVSRHQHAQHIVLIRTVNTDANPVIHGSAEGIRGSEAIMGDVHGQGQRTLVDIQDRHGRSRDEFSRNTDLQNHDKEQGEPTQL